MDTDQISNYHFTGDTKPAELLVENISDEEVSKRLAEGKQAFTVLFKNAPESNNVYAQHARALQLKCTAFDWFVGRLEMNKAKRYCCKCGMYGHKAEFCAREQGLSSLSAGERLERVEPEMANLTSRAFFHFFEAWSNYVFPMVCVKIHLSVQELLSTKQHNARGNVAYVFCRCCGQDITAQGINHHLYDMFREKCPMHGRNPPQVPTENLDVLRPDCYPLPLYTPFGEACEHQMRYFGGLLRCVGEMVTDIQEWHKNRPEVEVALASSSSTGSATCGCPACTMVANSQDYHTLVHWNDRDEVYTRYGVPLAKKWHAQPRPKAGQNARQAWVKMRRGYNQQRQF